MRDAQTRGSLEEGWERRELRRGYSGAVIILQTRPSRPPHAPGRSPRHSSGRQRIDRPELEQPGVRLLGERRPVLGEPRRPEHLHNAAQSTQLLRQLRARLPDCLPAGDRALRDPEPPGQLLLRQRPLRRPSEQEPAAIRRWLAEKSPAIQAAGRQAGATIHEGAG